ncbi:YCP4, partial [Symbiodinium sp. CCMP2456]
TISTFLSKRKRKLFVADLRFISDWVVIIYSLFIVGFFIVVQQSVWDLSAMVQELPTYSSSANSEQMDTYQQSWTSILDSVDMAAFYFDYFRVALFWYTLVIATQFAKIFAGQPKLAQLMSAFTHASEDLLHFSLLFFVLFLSFAIGGFMIWGMVMEEWSTPGKALNSTLRALLGNVNLSEMFFYSQFGTAVWYSAFFVSMLIITLNLLVAMVYDHYTIIKARAGAVSGVLEQLHWVGKDLASRLKGMSCMSKLTCCCRRAVRQIPEQKVLLEMFMERANLPTYEKAMIHTTVLGARWMRKERERSVFSGQDTSLDVAVNDPVGPDLANANMDQGYAEELAEHCKAFSDAAYDPEDARISQLRQLVATAEDEIVEMRLRLQACAEYSRASMHTLTRTDRKSEAGSEPRMRRVRSWWQAGERLAVAKTAEGLEEILERQLRGAFGQSPAPLGSLYCFQWMPRSTPGKSRGLSSVAYLFELIMDNELRDLEQMIDTTQSSRDFAQFFKGLLHDRRRELEEAVEAAGMTPEDKQRLLGILAQKATTLKAEKKASGVSVAVIYYSMYGHMTDMCKEMKKCMEDSGVQVDMFQVAETLPDEALKAMGAPAKPGDIMTLDHASIGSLLPEYDGFVFGVPTRFGNMCGQIKLLDCSAVLSPGEIEV